MSKEMKLSSCLYGHSLDVRSVATTRENCIVSGSRDKTAKLWAPNGINPGFSEAMTYRDQKNFVIAVLYLSPSEGYPDGAIVTGGNDNTIYVYKSTEPFATTTFKEHTNAVSCLCVGLVPGIFFSGSWDNTAKGWSLSAGSSSQVNLVGHTAAVWGIIQLQDGKIVTASADRTLGIWTNDGRQIRTLTGHTDCVRGLAELPGFNQFVSVSNDATVRLWSNSGDALDTYYGHSNFIYSVAARPGSGTSSFVTSGEDGTVRLWESGENTQTILLPVQSVWAVTCLLNGDVIAGSNDGIVRVFTQDERRFADEATLTKFSEEVQALQQKTLQEIGGYKVSDLPGKEALYDPGKTPGQIKMVRENGGVMAYSWVQDGDNSHWEKVGDVMGGVNKDEANKTTFEGKSYDFVFSVDVEDGKPPLKLPYNRGQDPYQAANEFLTRNILPGTYLEQVVDFILKNSQEQFVAPKTEYVDPFTGASRYTPGSDATKRAGAGVNLDPFTGGSSYSTGPRQEVKYFPISNYRIFEMGDPNVILGKLKEFNKKIGSDVDERALEGVVKICNGPPDDPNAFDVLFKLLDWPKEYVFPVLDVVRMSVRNQKNNEVMSTVNNGILLQTLLTFISDTNSIVNNIIVALRTCCNLFMHEQGEDLVYSHCFDLVEALTALGSMNKNAQVGMTTLLLNLVIAAIKRKDDLGVSVLVEVVPDILTRLNDPEAQFRGYVALGTLLTSLETEQKLQAVAKIKGNSSFLSAMELHLIGGGSDLEIKKTNCAKQVQAFINVS